MEKKETVFFLMNLKLIMKHGMLHLKNISQLNIMLGIHNSHFAVENVLREKAKDHKFNSALSNIGFEKIIKRLNRYNKWQYGYNKEHDIIVISKTGKIGEIYEIQNLRIALPKEEKPHEFENKTWTKTEYPLP